MNNYKGLFYNEKTKKLYYEGGAHFKYKDLVRELEAIKAKREEENEKNKKHSRNKSIEYFQEKKILENLQNNPKSNLITLDNDQYLFHSPIKDNKNNNNYIENLLSLDQIKTTQKRKIKLKDIKPNIKIKNYGENILNTENNNRYNSIDIDKKIRNKSFDIKMLNENNNYKNNVMLTEEKYNYNKNKNILNLKLLSKSNQKSYKNLITLSSLPKIESLYFNNISNKNIYDNNSNSNMATNSTNKKSEFNDPKNKMENEIEKKLKLADLHIFSLKKKLPHINVQSMSNINNINNINKYVDKNKILFNVNENKHTKKKFLINNSINNNPREILYDFDDVNNEIEDTIENINLKKNNYKILKMADSDKNKDIESVLLHKKNKKSHKKK